MADGEAVVSIQRFDDAVRALVDADPHNNKKAAELESWFDSQEVGGTGSTLVSESAMKQIGNRIQERAKQRKAVMVFAYRSDEVGEKLLERMIERLADPHDLYPEFEAAILVKSDGTSIEPKCMIRVRSNPVTDLLERSYPGMSVRTVDRSLAGVGGSTVPTPPFTDEDLSKDAFIPLEELRKMVDLLKRRKNVILQGPPGVGKSFIAKRIAYAAIGAAIPSRVLSLQFHANYSYEEFVEGYRPKEGETGFAVVAGNLRDFVESVVLLHESDEACVLILDEINRANLSSIFGEIMSLIEADKRGDQHAIRMLYSREPFFLPENLLVLGLMNTADRSLALVDYALRRRFAFVDLPPRFNADFERYLREKGIPDATIGQLLTAVNLVNRAIKDSAVSLGRGFEIGHSYFCRCPDLSAFSEADRASQAEAWLGEILQHDIGPLLREYWFDDRDTREEMMQHFLGRDLSAGEIITLVE